MKGESLPRESYKQPVNLKNVKKKISTIVERDIFMYVTVK